MRASGAVMGRKFRKNRDLLHQWSSLVLVKDLRAIDRDRHSHYSTASSQRDTVESKQTAASKRDRDNSEIIAMDAIPSPAELATYEGDPKRAKVGDDDIVTNPL